MRTIVTHPLLLSHSATCAIDREPTPNITRNLSGPALNGPVVFRANSANNASSIWCSVIIVHCRALSDFFRFFSDFQKNTAFLCWELYMCGPLQSEGDMNLRRGGRGGSMREE